MTFTPDGDAARTREDALGDWYYVGHYGQLGPLTFEQVDELIEAGVIMRETYVWRSGMANWLPAQSVVELQPVFAKHASVAPPDPPPIPQQQGQPVAQVAIAPPPAPVAMVPANPTYSPAVVQTGWMAHQEVTSDRSRLAAGILQLFLPGVGRMMLGYGALGAMQLVLAICSGGVLCIWSFIDGLLILTGNVKYDGYGRRLKD